MRKEKLHGVLDGIVLQWKLRSALRRCGLDPRCLSILQSARRSDGNALIVTLRCNTLQGLHALSERNLQTLCWSLGERVVLLSSDPYSPSTRRLLIESGPIVAGLLGSPSASLKPWNKYPIPLGVHGVTGEVVTLELWSPERGSKHLLVSGATSTGKSNAVNVILTGLLANRYVVLGIDGKGGSTLQPWASLLAAPVVVPQTNPQACVNLLYEIVELMEKRHAFPGLNYQPIVVIVEEWASLPAKPTEIGDLLERIAAQGRSASVGLIMTTQRPTSTSGSVRVATRGNLTARIALSTIGDRAASESILGAGDYGAAELPSSPAGLALVKDGGGVAELVNIYQCDGPTLGLYKCQSLEDTIMWDSAGQREMEASGSG
jgi:hypothetical protein